MYSFSGLSLSEDPKYGCWRKAWFRYGLDLRGASSPPLEFGKATHGIIETMINEGDLSIQKALLACIQASMDFSDDDMAEMERCINAFAVKQAVAQGGNVEEYFELQLDDMPFAPAIRGCIDYYFIEDDKIYLYDWKSNRATYKPWETHQLGLYADYLNKKYGLPVIGHLAFLRFDRVFSHEYTPEEIEKSRQWALNIALEYDVRIEKVKAGEDVDIHFPKQPGDGCEYCGYKNLCLQKCSVPEAITSYAEAVETLQGVAELKQFIKIYEDNLKKYIQNSGPVQADALIASLQKNEYLLFNLNARKAVIKRMLEQNLDIGSILKIGSDAQKALLEKHSWTEDDFLKLGAKRRATTRLSIDKVS